MPAPAPEPTPAPSAPGGPGGGAAPAPVLVPPRLVEFVHAVYPPAAQQAGLEAAVKLSLKVDDQGAVAEAAVLEPAGQGFDEAALAAARAFRFEPATFDGKPVGVEIRFTYRFELEQQLVTKPLAPPAAAAAGAAARLPVTLRGRVLRRGTREALPDVGIKVRGRDQLAETDLEGRFALALPPGQYALDLVRSDSRPYATDEEIRPGEALDVTYYLEARSSSPYHAIVEAARPKKSVTRTTLEAVELVQVPGTFGEPFRVVQTLPGVARAPFGLGLLIVRGAAPQDTGFFIDGHEVPLLYHFLVGTSVFQADLVQSIDFYPGGFPVNFGRKQAGIVTTRTKDEPAGEQLHGMAAVDLLDLEAMVKVPIGEKSQITLAGRRSHFDLLLPLVTDTAARPRYWDYQLVGTTPLGAGWNGKLTVFGSSDALDYTSEPSSQDDPGTTNEATLGIQFHRLHATASRGFAGGGRFELSGMFGYDRIASTFNENEILVQGYETTVRAEGSLPLVGERLTLTGGAEFTSLTLDTTVDFPGLVNWTDFPAPSRRGRDSTLPRTRYGFNNTGYAPALFAQLEWKLGPLLLIPGLRGEWYHYDEFDAFPLDPRLVARLKLRDELTLKGGVGLFHQVPEGQAMDSRFGNPDDLLVPYGLQTSVGAEYRPDEFFDIDATVFLNSYRNQLVAQQAKEEDGQVKSAASPFASDGEGRSYGLELLVRRKPRDGFFGWIAYTLSRAERREGSKEWILFGLDQTHILTAVASYALTPRWTLGAKFQLVSGNPRTPILGGAYDSDTNDYTPIYGAALSDRADAFHQLDLRLDRSWLFDTWKLMAYLDVINVYNHGNVEFLQYNYDFSRSGAITGLPFLPSLGVKGEF